MESLYEKRPQPGAVTPLPLLPIVALIPCCSVNSPGSINDQVDPRDSRDWIVCMPHSRSLPPTIASRCSRSDRSAPRSRLAPSRNGFRNSDRCSLWRALRRISVRRKLHHLWQLPPREFPHGCETWQVWRPIDGLGAARAGVRGDAGRSGEGREGRGLDRRALCRGLRQQAPRYGSARPYSALACRVFAR